MNYNISIVGLGKLGSSMLAAYASKGHRAIGVDINPKFIEAINQGQAPVKETDLQEYITQNLERISATNNYAEAVQNSQITFVIVPTPSDETGGFSVEFAKKAFVEIGLALKEKKDYHLVVLTSTVLPEACEKLLIPVLEENSGKKCGPDFGFCYSPEFIAIGSVVRDLLNPDFFLIGEFDKKSGGLLEDFYANTSNNSAKTKRMNIPSAELTKISINHFLTTKITFANMLAEVAHSIPRVNVDDVTGALGSDTRIGHKYLKGGLGFGGPCFPRDNRAFASMAEQRNVKVPYAQNTDIYNKSIIDRMVRIIKENSTEKSRIGILGLSYKPGTGFCEESQGLNIAKKLAEAGHSINVFEENGHYHAQTLLGEAVTYCENLDELLKNSDLIFLTNWDKNNLILKDKKFDQKITIVDPWRQFPAGSFAELVIYLPLGQGPAN